MTGMPVEPHTADQQGPPEVKPPSRTVRVLTSWKLWISLLVFGLLIIGVSLSLPIVQRLRVLHYFDEHSDIAGYELSLEHEDWPARYGEWANALRPVESVWCWYATDEVLHYAGKLHEARSLHLKEDASHPITEWRVANLRRLDRLRELKLFGGGFTDDAIAGLMQVQHQLEKVVLIDTGAAHQSMMAMSECPSIVELVVYTESLDDEDFRDLAPLASLKRLTVTGAGDECLKWIASCPNVADVRLIFASVTDEGLRDLSACQNLRSLSVHGGSITDAGLRSLEAIPALEELILVECPGITSEGIAQFPDMPNLRTLGIPVDLLTVESIARLKELPELRRLETEGWIADAELNAQLKPEWSVYEEGMIFTTEQIWELIRRTSLDAW